MEHLISTWGYGALVLLMLAESACVPIPSEVIMPFAGALAAAGRMELAAVILLGVLGEAMGAFLSWGVGWVGGRPLVQRFGRYVLVSTSDLDKAEAWLHKHGTLGILIGRVLPTVRTFISLPAGIARMPAARFGVPTVLGSLVWDAALAGVGYALGSRWHEIVHGFQSATYVLAALLVLALVAGVVYRWRVFKRDQAASHPADVPGRAR